MQHEIVPRVSVNVGYFRRWYGNLQRHRQPVAHAGRLQPVQRDGAARLAASRRRRVSGHRACTTSTVSSARTTSSTLASKFGTATEVFNGVDITVNARLPQGHRRLGRSEHRPDAKATTASPSTRRRARGCRRRRARTSAAGLLYCDVKPPFQPNVKLIGVYPLPWGGIQLAATFQSLPGPQITASQHVHQRRDRAVARPQPRDGRRRHGGRAAHSAGHDVRRAAVSARFPRVEDLPVRPQRLQANVDVYNAGNASSILSINTDVRLELAAADEHPAGPAGEVRRTVGLLALLLRSDRAGSKRRRVTKTRRSRRSRTKPTGFFVSFVPSR